MFRRAFWFTAGAAAGVWATTKVNRQLKKLTPESLAAQAADKAVEAGHRLKDFALDVKAGMSQREDELNDALGLHQDADNPALTDNVTALPGPRRLRAIPNDKTTHRSNHSRVTPNRNEDH
ncbi:MULTISPECIES: DUF6167 family protein [unclassified Streptomyces]|uniref:DUF6167 family protein n=1 Tax=unclassified Streptomyces TaxID=2593676 RepID=UPI001BE80DE0|nr:MULTISPECIES: DUF6167 family protein [unclassified Streptomyces]MBT2407178.1 hypothetical protein [Streptomyces sp. ISL-21]MBT2455714.1 hypothetical protein [Streptomyces sp. ISL-86]MBT2612067.1 hypothetical protein [Streptomyces sp. ISL-87]